MVPRLMLSLGVPHCQGGVPLLVKGMRNDVVELGEQWHRVTDSASTVAVKEGRVALWMKQQLRETMKGSHGTVLWRVTVIMTSIFFWLHL